MLRTSGGTIDVLSVSEATALTLCEAQIEQCKAAFLEVGNALARIRDERLYRATHSTFEAYCKARWDISASYAIKQETAARVVSNLKADNCPVVPETESQARPLSKLPKAEQSAAWADAVASSPNGKPTAKQVERVVKERLSTTDHSGTFTCRNCGENRLSDNGPWCDDCGEPLEPPRRKRKFDHDQAYDRTSELLDQIDALWPDDHKQEMLNQIVSFVNSVTDFLESNDE